MKLEKSESLKIKYQAMLWLRLRQRCPFIATEAGPNSADVLGISEKRMIEIEVKTSKADFLADFRKYKHKNYTGQTYCGSAWDVQWIPNQFYYAVPDEMIDVCREILERKNSSGESYEKYGLISAGSFTVVKRAKKLHDREPTSHAKFSLALRMGSELLRFHEAWI